MTAAEIISNILIREADKLSKVSAQREPLTQEQLESLEVLAKIDRFLRPPVTPSKTNMSEEEALRIVEAHRS